ncbi:DnaJ domain-containing protein [Pseudanabaena sp. FACHB-1998]|uniref:DnaJ domain-containing protein n=1 Tax=Pseudanabaena sp. FACHB-1998 TaxID=2692858 RepID=UPI001F549608|nr:DnaJ domain-containing protein [Pseudanabaena sp. FACHB-1998]
MNKPQPPKAQFIRFDRGISQYNHDYYAALGLPLISNSNYIRNVYLRIARILHPDVYGFSADEKIIATQYLAKLVNPAYNALMKEQDRSAYQEIFKLLAKRLMLRSRNITIHSESACELIMTPSEDVYERLVTEIAKVQYQSLPQILDYTAQISELNLVYILYKAGYRHGASNMPPVLAPKLTPTSTKIHTSNPLPPPSKPSYGYNLQYAFEKEEINLHIKSEDTVIQARADETLIQDASESGEKAMINNRIKVCEIYILQSNWKAALQDLREILRMDANNSKCLALLGVVYININQLQMAKASFKRSLYINPQEPLALKHLLELEESDNPPSSTDKNAKNSAKPKPTKIKKPNIQPEHGWLSHLLKWISSRRS